MNGDSDTRTPDRRSFQARAFDWMLACFKRPDSLTPEQRSFRFLEEALELAQAVGTTREEALKLVDYVYSRPIGQVGQEIGGVMVTLAGVATVCSELVNSCAEDELARCIANTAKIRMKDLNKPERSPLPGATT